jgi:hypothetical protein
MVKDKCAEKKKGTDLVLMTPNRGNAASKTNNTKEDLGPPDSNAVFELK